MNNNRLTYKARKSIKFSYNLPQSETQVTHKPLTRVLSRSRESARFPALLPSASYGNEPSTERRLPRTVLEASRMRVNAPIRCRTSVYVTVCISQPR